MTGLLYVDSVGSQETFSLVPDALVLHHKIGFFAATCAWELCTIPSTQKVDIAVLHDTLSNSELSSCARYIRNNWPSAQIHLIIDESEVLDDPLYDERASPRLSPEDMLGVIEYPANSKSETDGGD
jgi:hypothetical protein